MIMSRNHTYNFRFQILCQKFCRPIILQPSVAIARCRKTCFPQIVLLQGKVKPYLSLQNLVCHCKILRWHFDTQKRLKHCVGDLESVSKCKQWFDEISVWLRCLVCLHIRWTMSQSNGYQLLLLEQHISEMLFCGLQRYVISSIISG